MSPQGVFDTEKEGYVMNGKTLSVLFAAILLSMPFCAISCSDCSDAATVSNSEYTAYNVQGEMYYRTGSMITIFKEVKSFDGVIFSSLDIGDRFDEYYAGRCLISDIHSVMPSVGNSYYVYFSDAGRIYYSDGSSVSAANLSSTKVPTWDSTSYVAYIAAAGYNVISVNDSHGKDITVRENGNIVSKSDNGYFFTVGGKDDSRVLSFEYSSEDGSFATIIDCTVTPDTGTAYFDTSIDYENVVGTIYGDVGDAGNVMGTIQRDVRNVIRDEDQIRFFVNANQTFRVSVNYDSYTYDMYLVNRSGEVMPLLDQVVYDMVFDKGGEYYVMVVSEGISDSTLCAEYGLYLEGVEEEDSDVMPLAIAGLTIFVVIFALFLVGSRSVRWM